MLKYRRDHIQQHFNQAARTYDEAAVLQKRIAEDMDQRLELVTLAPERMLDLGAGTGFLSARLQRRYPGAQLLALDLSPQMLQAANQRLHAQRPRWWQAPFGRRPTPRLLNADAHALPLADQSVDLVMTNLMLQWCDDPDRVFAEIRRVLRPEGLLMFSSFGPDTLTELRQAWSNVDARDHVSTFIDMHDLGDALIRNGFGQPVMDTSHFTLTYDQPMGVLKDLKAIGATNASQGRAHGLTGKTRFQKMLSAYEGFRQQSDGRIPSTFEVVQGHAWAAEEVAKGPNRDKSGHIEISLDEFSRQTKA